MWVWTQESELVNLEHVEFVRLERNDGHYEVRAYPFQWIESEDEVYYTLASRPDEHDARSLLNGVVAALAAGNRLLDLTGAGEE